MNYYFKTESLIVGYNQQPIVTSINITLPKGQILSLIGPNGAGKSTILKTIIKQLLAVKGKIYLNNQDLLSLSLAETSKQLAVVLTDPIQTEMMTCDEVVSTGRYPYTGKFGLLTAHDHIVIEEALKLVDAFDLRGHEFNKISDGQKQRILLARAICQEPDLIILDEPTSYLDIKYKLSFLSALQKLCIQKQLTVIMSLHELDLAERISDQILCVNGLYTEQYGKPEQIFQPGILKNLFNISDGSYNELTGHIELPAPTGPADTFIIAGNGSGKSVYHHYQRLGHAFYTGILYENDHDAPIAKALAKKAIICQAFELPSEVLINEAKAYILESNKIICCRQSFGALEKCNEELLQFAILNNKKISYIK